MAAADASASSLQIPHLRRLWRRIAEMEGRQGAAEPTEWAADQAVIYGLGLGLHETLAYLHSATRSYANFERWVLERNGGAVDKQQIDRINAAVALAKDEGATAASPRDGFAPVFEETDLRFWDDNGYVVLRNAVSAGDAYEAALAIWDYLGMDPGDPQTWYGTGKCEGIFVPLVHHPALDKNRREQRIRNAFVQLWGTADLQVTIDRGGFNPPERPGWKFSAPGLHWDTSLVPPIPPNIHGILYLTDTPAEQGAFRCVPGFHRRLESWLATLPAGANPRAEDLTAEEVRVPGRAGDMVIWHAALPHAASPNHGGRPRLVQYIAYQPPMIVDERPWI